MSDSAKVRWNTAPSTQEFGTICQESLEGLKGASTVKESSNGTAETEDEEIHSNAEAIIPTLPRHPKCFATTGARKKCLGAIRTAMESGTHQEGELEVEQVTMLAQGGYNDVWLVSITSNHQRTRNQSELRQLILREPHDDALLPYQIENEIAWLTFMGQYHPAIPVPKVYAYDTWEFGQPFIAMEYVNGDPLSSVWNSFTEPEKWDLARSIADIILDLGEITFDHIGGLTLGYEIGPTVEGAKLYKGRAKIHSSECYDIGPYPSTRAYILACYDKEIYYYSHATNDDIDQDLFDQTPKEEFINRLQEKRAALAASASTGLPEEPFAVAHKDLQGRNIMVRDKRICAVLDWGFAGAYPLSQLVDTGVDVLEMETDEDEDEDFLWSHRITDLVAERAKDRGWEDVKIKTLVAQGREELNAARMEMFPRD